jgi:hypothetical protein
MMSDEEERKRLDDWWVEQSKDKRAISTKLWVWFKGPNALWGRVMLIVWAWIWR